MATKSLYLSLEDQTAQSVAVLLNLLATQHTLLSAHGENLQLGVSQITPPEKPAERFVSHAAARAEDAL